MKKAKQTALGFSSMLRFDPLIFASLLRFCLYLAIPVFFLPRVSPLFEPFFQPFFEFG